MESGCRARGINVGQPLYDRAKSRTRIHEFGFVGRNPRFVLLAKIQVIAIQFSEKAPNIAGSQSVGGPAKRLLTENLTWVPRSSPPLAKAGQFHTHVCTE